MQTPTSFTFTDSNTDLCELIAHLLVTFCIADYEDTADSSVAERLPIWLSWLSVRGWGAKFETHLECEKWVSVMKLCDHRRKGFFFNCVPCRMSVAVPSSCIVCCCVGNVLIRLVEHHSWADTIGWLSAADVCASRIGSPTFRILADFWGDWESDPGKSDQATSDGE